MFMPLTIATPNPDVYEKVLINSDHIVSVMDAKYKRDGEREMRPCTSIFMLGYTNPFKVRESRDDIEMVLDPPRDPDARYYFERSNMKKESRLMSAVF